MKSNRAFYMLACLLAVASVAEANAQTAPYPNKPVQIITDSSAGSTPDVALRIVADGLSQVWKQQVLVTNHPGAGGKGPEHPEEAMCVGPLPRTVEVPRSGAHRSATAHRPSKDFGIGRGRQPTQWTRWLDERSTLDLQPLPALPQAASSFLCPSQRRGWCKTTRALEVSDDALATSAS
jgi:hypothetical protein